MIIRTADELRAEFFNDRTVLSGRLTEAREAIHLAYCQRVDVMRRRQDAADGEHRQATATEQREQERDHTEANRLELLLREVGLNEVDRSISPTGHLSSTGVDADDRAVALGPEQRMTDWVQRNGLAPDEHQGLHLGRLLRGFVTGSWSAGDDRERRVLAEGALADGGVLVPTPLAASIIDLARNRSRVFQAGARVVPMQAATLKTAKLVGEAMPGWRDENAAIPEDDLTFGAVDLHAHTLAVIVKSSRELVEDASGLDTLIRESLASSFALKLDWAGLYADGTTAGTEDEPTGVRSQAGVTITALGTNGASPTWDNFIDATGVLQDANFEPTAIIEAPRTERTLAKLKDANGQYLAVPQVLAGVPRLTTNQVPTNLTKGTAVGITSDAFIADWRNLLVGMRTEFGIQVLRERYASEGQIGFLAWMRADIALARADSFVVLEGIKA